jgi:hypothetical protein
MGESSSNSSVSVGCGCLPFVLSCLVLWFLIFGLTWNHKHYDLSCSCAQGVELETTARP